MTEWHQARVRDIVSSVDAGVSVNGEARKKREGEVGVLKVSAVSSMVFDPDAYKVVIKKDRHRVKESPLKEHIIVSRSNTPELVGASALVDKHYPDLYLSDKLWQLKLNAKRDTSVKWLSLLLASAPVRYRLSQLATGTSHSMKNISKNDLLTLPVAIPPYEEQVEIARIISAWDSAIRITAQQVTAKQERRRALVQQLLSGQRRFPEFNDKWRIYKLGDIINPVVRATKKPTVAYDVIGIRSHCKGTFSKRVEEPEKVAMEELYIAKTNDLIVNITFAWEGAIAIVPQAHDGFFVSHRFPTYTANAEYLITDYLSYLVTQPYFIHRLGVISPGGAGRNRVLNKKDFLKLEVELPGIEEQIRIASLLKNIDKEIDLLKELLNAYKEQKKGLMQQLLTGRMKVNSSNNDSGKKNIIPDQVLA